MVKVCLASLCCWYKKQLHLTGGNGAVWQRIENLMGIIEGHRHQAACKDEKAQLFLAGLLIQGKALE